MPDSRGRKQGEILPLRVGRTKVLLFHDLGDDEEIVFFEGGVAGDVGADVTVGDLVFAQAQAGGFDRSHGLDAFGVDLVEHGHPIENARQFALKALGLGVRDLQAREAGDAADGFFIDMHGEGGSQRCMPCIAAGGTMRNRRATLVIFLKISPHLNDRGNRMTIPHRGL